MKEGATGFIEQTVLVQYSYTKVIVQITRWVEQGLVVKPMINASFGELEFVPTNIAQM